MELREAIRRSRVLAAAGRAGALAGATWLAGLMFGFANVRARQVRFGCCRRAWRADPDGKQCRQHPAVGTVLTAGGKRQRNAAIDALKLVAVQNGERFFGEITNNEA